MIAAFRVLGIIIAWFALNEVVRTGLYLFLGDDADYGVPAVVVYTAIFSIAIKVAGAALLLFYTEKVVSMLQFGFNESVRELDLSLSVAAASLVGIYFFIQGLSTSISTYVVMRMRVSTMDGPRIGVFDLNRFHWAWQDFVYGLVQAILGAILVIAVIAYGKSIKSRGERIS
ncbi:hypothetical protein K8B33_15635 [Alcanivorax sp. JB21]|uniref:hypothetical protein n=1 Tax=Alcanivorax limicola TaxID=2874102 RepID=UPI001CC1AC9A|nr:hypothetical protein [Alcanivorax limicola]MBZ2190541.1 hypothetical protein [Alcanivorax limicola]